MNPKADSQYLNLKSTVSEISHRYPKNIHILSNPYLLSTLARLCAMDTFQPLINELITSIYSDLLRTVVNQEFEVKPVALKTRMSEFHAEGVYQGPMIDPEQSAVTVNLARAGTLPSHICYSAMNYFLNPSKVRQDHISIARVTDGQHQVKGSNVSGHKIGGSIDGSIVLLPDPMGATGSTLVETLDLYKTFGKAKKFIAMHCIITPEYIRYVTAKHPELIVYAVRLDRGLSSPDILDTVPGTHIEKERGLNEKQYIVPGGGGFGEILNNAFV